MSLPELFHPLLQIFFPGLDQQLHRKGSSVLLLDVKLFKVCSRDFIVFQKYFGQLGFNNAAT